MHLFDSLRGAVGDTLFYGAISPAIKILVLLFLGILPVITYLVLAERKILGFIQARVGPNRVGPWGILQPIADVMKLLVKEDTLPTQAVKWAFILAPCLVVGPALIIFAVIPVGPPAPAPGKLAWYVTDVNTGVLVILALATIGVYGLIIGGWSSNNKFSLMGGLRAASQMVSYEVTMGLTLIGTVMIYGTLQVDKMILWQQEHTWGIFAQPLAFVLFFAAAVAESKRIPFDIPEGESEIVAGYFVEYSGMKFGLFMISEFVEVVVLSGVVAALFFGGYHLPFGGEWVATQLRDYPLVYATLLGTFFFAKIAICMAVYVWIRWTFPRFRYDQLMRLGWKVLLPLSILNLILVAAMTLAGWL